MFITIEGIDGSGKSTQAQMVCRWLRNHGATVTLTKEPSVDTLFKDQIRNILLNTNISTPEAEVMLFLADRCEHITQVIKPGLNPGTVICDRYNDSTLAYQVGGRGVNEQTVLDLMKACNILIPDLTIYIDVSPQRAFDRLVERGNQDRFELGLDFLTRVYEYYKKLISDNPQRFLVVDGVGTQHEVHTRILDVLPDFDFNQHLQ